MKTMDYFLGEIENELKKALPLDGNFLWQKSSFGNLDENINSEHTKPLVETCRSLVDLGGKRWRPLLLILMARLTSISKGKSQDEIEKSENLALHLTPLVEFCHTASLIHDDLEDHSEQRRGKPCAYITYGSDVALNSGSWLYFHASSAIQNLEIPAEEKNVFYETYLTELRRLHLGQAMDIKWHNDNKIIPEINEYYAMVKNKTGTLSRLAVKLGVLSGGGSMKEAETAGILAEEIGVGFQIIDDCINIESGNPGKKRGDDIVEGKKSLPVLLFLKNNGEKLHLLESCFVEARKDGIESPAVERAVELLLESGCVNEARSIGFSLIDEKVNALINFYGKNGMESEEGKLISAIFSKMSKKS